MCLWRVVMVVCLPCAVQAMPVLKCQFEVNAETYTHVFHPVADPYPVKSVDLAQRFRFKAVVLGSDKEVDLINLYVSHVTQRQPVLMQHLKFVKPTSQRQPEPNALTGRVALYSPYQGKELVYGCALHEVTP